MCVSREFDGRRHEPANEPLPTPSALTPSPLRLQSTSSTSMRRSRSRRTRRSTTSKKHTASSRWCCTRIATAARRRAVPRPRVASAAGCSSRECALSPRRQSERFLNLKTAYDVLCDEDRRRNYDAFHASREYVRDRRPLSAKEAAWLVDQQKRAWGVREIHPFAVCILCESCPCPADGVCYACGMTFCQMCVRKMHTNGKCPPHYPCRNSTKFSEKLVEQGKEKDRERRMLKGSQPLQPRLRRTLQARCSHDAAATRARRPLEHLAHVRRRLRRAPPQHTPPPRASDRAADRDAPPGCSLPRAGAARDTYRERAKRGAAELCTYYAWGQTRYTVHLAVWLASTSGECEILFDRDADDRRRSSGAPRRGRALPEGGARRVAGVPHVGSASSSSPKGCIPSSSAPLRTVLLRRPRSRTRRRHTAATPPPHHRRRTAAAAPPPPTRPLAHKAPRATAALPQPRRHSLTLCPPPYPRRGRGARGRRDVLSPHARDDLLRR